MVFIDEFNEEEIKHGLTNFIRSLIGKIVFIKDFIFNGFQNWTDHLPFLKINRQLRLQ